MVTQAPIGFLDFLFMITVALLERGGTFSNILPSATLASGQVYHANSTMFPYLKMERNELCDDFDI
jgi:hypothetical protein